ncbi:protein kinase [Cystoisospora suis]|uniref:Protein kinase n=1 Tax=Cystoisospora suis TaxID=483139 RepID=A0A2C6K758_9APIC|nr:protein kinase [Cystoisospora suis]
MGFPSSFEQFVSYEPWDPSEYNQKRVIAKAIHGVVHLAEHLPTKQLRAVKKIPNQNIYKRSHGQLENALVEIGASLYLSRHAVAPVESIIKTYGAFRDDTDTYLVTEYAAGGELFNEVARVGHIDEDHARRIGLQLLLGVKSLHDNGVCHRDLSLENTLLHSDGTIRIIDFGQAEPLFDDRGKEKNLVNAAGKMYYRAPEMYSGSYRGSAVDIFAVGVELFILVFGTPPWLQATNLDDRFVFIQTCPNGFERLLARWKRQHYVSKELRNLIRWMILADPFKRPSADEALAHPWFVNADPMKDSLLLSFLRSRSQPHRAPRGAPPRRSLQSQFRSRGDRDVKEIDSPDSTTDHFPDVSTATAEEASRSPVESTSGGTSPRPRARPSCSPVPKRAAVPPPSSPVSAMSHHNQAPATTSTELGSAAADHSVSSSPTSQRLRAISLLANRLAGLRFCRPSQPQASGGARPAKRHLSDTAESVE